jgi:hypothetical protein
MAVMVVFPQTIHGHIFATIYKVLGEVLLKMLYGMDFTFNYNKAHADEILQFTWRLKYDFRCVVRIQIAN